MTGIHDYSDILLMERPEPRFHPRMPMADRAAQFAPFAALSGFSEVIQEVGRPTDEKRILDEREIDKISRKLTALQSRIKTRPFISVIFFVHDEKKNGGSYLTFSGNLKKIDTYQKQLVFSNGVKIDFEDIFEIRNS